MVITGQPADADTLLFAVPVCAPYDVLQKYKFMCKLTPGGHLKGKAARHAIDMLIHSPACATRCALRLLCMPCGMLSAVSPRRTWGEVESGSGMLKVWSVASYCGTSSACLLYHPPPSPSVLLYANIRSEAPSKLCRLLFHAPEHSSRIPCLNLVRLTDRRRSYIPSGMVL
jgi:NFACT protein C-terminal domain